MNSDGWEKVKLGDIANYSKDRIDVCQITINNYVSTENMMPQKSGVTYASSLPNSVSNRYRKNQTLISNIRPYFKKIWLASNSGGCSADVLVFDIKANIDYKYFFYLLSQDAFFDYMMLGSKGTKMPRGDKRQIMQFSLHLPSFLEQKSIAATLSCLDDKIELNNRMNKTLEEMAQLIFKSWFVDFEPFQDGEFVDSELGRIPKGWRVLTLDDIVYSIDNRGKTPPLSLQPTAFPIIDVKALNGNSRIINYDNCTKFVEENTYRNWFRSGHPKQNDILMSTVGSLAEIKIFYGSKGCVAQNVVGFRSKGLSPLYIYQYLLHIKKDLISYNIGSVQPSIKVSQVIKHKIVVPEHNALTVFHDIINTISNKILENSLEIQYLIDIRNSLLPKLMSGEIRVPIQEE